MAAIKTFLVPQTPEREYLRMPVFQRQKDQARRVFFFACLLALCSTNCATIRSTPPSLSQTPNYREETLINDEGLRLFVRHWSPPKNQKQKGLIIFLHGVLLHGGVYSSFLQEFSQVGYDVVAMDLQGFGYSQGTGRPGYVDSYDRYAADLSLLWDKLKASHADREFFLMADSMGATIALYSQLKYKFPLRGLILNSPGYKPNPLFLGIRPPQAIGNLNRFFAKFWGKLFPHLPSIASGLHLKVVIEDDELQNRLETDPLVTTQFLPAAFMSEMIQANEFIEENLQHLESPLLIFYGKRDALMPLSSVNELFEKTNSTSKTLKILDAPHATFLEPGYLDLTEVIRKWLINSHN